MVEFVMLGIPALLLFSTGITMFGNSLQDSALRSIAIDASRYAALADQSYDSAKSYMAEKLARLEPNVKVVSQLQLSNSALVEIEYYPGFSILNLANRSVKIRVETPLEIR